MKKETFKSILILSVFGLLLAFIKIIYLFFDFYNILDIVVFSIAGFALGPKVPPNRLALGGLLALPAFLLCLILVLRLGYSPLLQGVGTSYALSLILIPLATYIGIMIRLKHYKNKYS